MTTSISLVYAERERKTTGKKSQLAPKGNQRVIKIDESRISARLSRVGVRRLARRVTFAKPQFGKAKH